MVFSRQELCRILKHDVDTQKLVFASIIISMKGILFSFSFPIMSPR